MNFSRRAFLKSGGVAMIGMSTLPAFLRRAIASTPMPNRKKLVVLFQRGAADGLNMVVPFAEPNYYRLRPSIAIPQPRQGGEGAAIDLDGFFGLHPNLAPLLPLFQKNQLAIVHAAGSPDTTRSHFDAQDYMESGTPGQKTTDDGWLNRALQAAPEPDASPFRAVAMGANLPLTLRGLAPAIALPDVNQFKVFSQSRSVEGGFEALYAQTVDQALRGTGAETFEAIDMLRKADPARLQPENGANVSAQPRGTVDAAGGAAAQGRHWPRSYVRRHQRLGQPCERRRCAGTACQPVARPGPVFSGIFAGYGRPDGGYRCRHHVRVRPHRARKRQPRHRSWPCQLHVRDGRTGERAERSTASGRALIRNSSMKDAISSSPPTFAPCWAKLSPSISEPRT